jgi:hypothetical protein
MALHPEVASAARLGIAQAYTRAVTLVTDLRPIIEEVAKALVDEHVLTAERVSSMSRASGAVGR